jgi:hypothetical protein
MEKKIINLAILGGVGYLVYSNWSKIKKTLGIAPSLGDSTATEQVADKASATGTTTIPQMDAYGKKVAQLQTLLGSSVSVDGKAGKQTNGELENLYVTPKPLQIPYETSFSVNYPYLRANGKGKVSSSNIDFYISAVKNKTTPVQLYYKNNATSPIINDKYKPKPTPYKLPWQ